MNQEPKYKMMTKNLISGIVISGLMAGVASGALLRYRGSGDWSDVYTGSGNGWANNDGSVFGAAPGAADDARVNFGGNTITVTTTTTTFNKLAIGVDESGAVVVNNDGVITVSNNLLAGNNNPAATGTLTVNSGGEVNVGNILYVANGSSTGILNVNSGGVVNTDNHLWWGTTGTATINISGTLNQSDGILGLGTSNASTAGGGTATVNVLSGGVFALNNISGAVGLPSIQAGSVLDINGTGLLTVKGSKVGLMNDYITASKITGSGTLSVSYNGSTDLTSVVVVPEPGAVSLLGMVGVVALLRRRRHS